MNRALPVLVAMMLGMAPVCAAPLQSDCRGSGTVGVAVMSQDGTVTLNLRSSDGAEAVLAYRRDDPNYARIVSHLGGIRPGEHKPIPSFC